MSEDQFTKLFKAMQDGFADVNKRLDQCSSKDQLSAVYDLLSKNIAEHERQEQERAAMNHQLNRHDQAIDQVANQVGATLHYAD